MAKFVDFWLKIDASELTDHIDQLKVTADAFSKAAADLKQALERLEQARINVKEDSRPEDR
jgi:hypothetical protein